MIRQKLSIILLYSVLAAIAGTIVYFTPTTADAVSVCILER